jgi:L-threonylcarbamoyladenylate synthase
MTIVPFRTPSDVAAVTDPLRKHLDGGGLLAYPTETVYGLGSRATAADVEALVDLKGRRAGKPFLLLVAGRDMAVSCGLRFTRAAEVIADFFWPGPVTLVLSGGEGHLPQTLRGPEGGVAVRWTSHPGIASLIADLGYPITSTSANRPGEPTAAGPTQIADQFADAVSAGSLLVLDGGTLGNQPPSTVIDCTQRVPRIIREGAITAAELRNAVGSLAP